MTYYQALNYVIYKGGKNMTRKDYVLIAECINKAIKTSTDKVTLANNIINNFNAELARTNSNFKHDKFVEACLK